MRKMLIAVVALALLWSGYWVVGSFALRRGFAGWVAQQRAAGVTVDYSDLTLLGFPSRFDLTLTRPDVYDPQTGIGWKAPFVQVFALSYNPYHLIAVWPHSQTLTLQGKPLTITSADMRASLVFRPGASFVLDRTRLDIKQPRIGDWALNDFIFASSRAGDDTSHRLGLQVDALTLPSQVRTLLDPEHSLPGIVDRLHLDATLGFDRRIDRHVLEHEPKLIRLDLADLTVAWADLGLTAKGTLTADASGAADGALDLTLTHWRRILTLAVNAGLIPEADRNTAERLLGFLARGDRLTSKLTFKNGVMLLGPIPLGPAPRLSQR